MFEIKITINAPELTEAIKNLAAAFNSTMAIQAKRIALLQSRTRTPVSKPTPAPVPVQNSVVPVPVQATPQVPTVPTVPIAGVPLADAPQFTVEQIMTAGATLMDAGKVDDLFNLLHSFGVQAVMELKPEQLGAFATEMRKLGATI